MPSSNAPTACLILAAGQGTRMKSARPKVLHDMGGRSLLGHALAVTGDFGTDRVGVVLGRGMDEVAAAVTAMRPGTFTAIQDPPLGTAHAVLAARDDLGDFAGDVFILFADTPLIRAETLTRMVEARRDGAGVVVLGFDAADPGAYGRLIVGADNMLDAIVEAKDATPEQLALTFCNSGVMAVDGALLWDLLDRVGNDNAKGEYYLTDIVAIARARGIACAAVACDEQEVMGVNTQGQLAEAERVFQNRMREAAMDAGVTMADPSTVYFSYDTELSSGVTLEPHVFFGPGVSVSAGVKIRAYSHFEQATVHEGATVGPFARLRPGADIGPGAHVGNFVEIKKSVVEQGAKVNHLTYIGDAFVGAKANIGAGTITCNYDGFDKHQTHIGRGAFIGSNSSLVAPVTIGDGAYTGSGSVIYRDVAKDALALERGPQVDKEGWARKLRDRKMRDRG